MKRIAMLILLIFILLPTDVQAAEQEEQVEIDDWMLDQIPMEDLETYWHHIQSNYGAFIDELSNKNLKELLKQYEHISFKSILKEISQVLFYVVHCQIKLVIKKS